MYAALHVHAGDDCSHELRELAHEFSPAVEESSADTVTFSIAPLRKLMGSPHQIASEISRFGHARKLEANLAIASNPDTAILLARYFRGVTLVTPGEEQFRLAPIPLTALLAQKAQADPKLLETLEKWGLKTCGELAQLPEKGVAERLGPAGVFWRRLALGNVHRPLRIPPPPVSYEKRMQLDHPVQTLEPLLFLFGRVLGDLCQKLRTHSRAARLLHAHLELDDAKECRCKLEFPVPLDDSATLLKLLQLHLERHAPGGAVNAFTLQLEPVTPRRVQGGFFRPPAPAPDKLQVTLARIAGLVGKENVGTPVLLDTYRPDAFELVTPNVSAETAALNANADSKVDGTTLRLAIRLFRPALEARVRVAGAAPRKIIAPGVKGNVLQVAGPWKTSGEWWAPTAWNREEWDVALDDGALYRIYLEMRTHQWYVHGVYD